MKNKYGTLDFHYWMRLVKFGFISSKYMNRKKIGIVWLAGNYEYIFVFKNNLNEYFNLLHEVNVQK